MGLLTTVEVCRELGIPRSTLYYLQRSGAVPLPQKRGGRRLWDEEHLGALRAALAQRRKERPPEPLPCKTVQIQNRRYLGSKYKLLPFIKRVVRQECEGVHTVADIFAGTGVVASAFPRQMVTLNDNMAHNCICATAWFSGEAYDRDKLIRLICHYNAAEVDEENYMSRNFGDTYYSRAVCRKIGYIREDIERRYRAGELGVRERALLITSLLYAMDKIANTCGHYDAYRKGGDLSRPFELCLPEPPERENPRSRVFCEDANELVRHIEADLVYIDPPYNSRQYCDAYHLLENVARWECPPVHGVARKMDRAALKSDYCTREAAAAFADLVGHINARYILLSYNNMGRKGDERSNAKISDEDILRILRRKGEVKVFSTGYRAFSAGKSQISENAERLFLCICRPERQQMASPLNYTGGKYKLLPQLLPHFPKGVERFVDLFCGGCNVGLSCGCSKVLFSDDNAPLLALYETLRTLPKEETFRLVGELIDRYGLSRVSEHGYGHYGCDGANGLAEYNREGYLRLREDFNRYPLRDARYYIMLYVLIVFSFNNQIRFNKRGEFNLPPGKRDFNNKMAQKLSSFIDRLQSGDYEFLCSDFRQLDPSMFHKGDFVYADPPYLIACATYNEQGGWGEREERALFDFLDELDKRGVPFALSNVLRSKGRQNDLLLSWLKSKGGRYKVADLKYSYSNASYQTKDRTSGALEVLVTNYSLDASGALVEEPGEGKPGLKRLWSMSTTVRNPYRIRDFLATLQQLEGREWNNETQVRFQTLLIQNRLYRPGDGGLSERQREMLGDPFYEMTYDEASEIFRQKNYQDPPMRGRTSFKPLEKWGLAFILDGRIAISQVGHRLLLGEEEVDDVCFRSLLKWQYPNPLSNQFAASAGYDVKPFVATLQLISRVNGLCAERGQKQKGISRTEFGIFALSLCSWRDVERAASALLDFRARYEELAHDRNAQHEFYLQTIATWLRDYQNANEQNIRDYADNAIRYFRLTKYIYIRGGGYYVDLEPRRQRELHELLRADCGAARSFADKEEYVRYLSDYESYPLPWESARQLRRIALGIAEELGALCRELGLPESAYPLGEDVAALKEGIRFLRAERLRLQNLSLSRRLRQGEEFARIIDALGNITHQPERPSVALEKWARLALQAIGDAKAIIPNCPMGDDNEPTFTAPGDKADIETDYGDYGGICEVTMLTSRDQWYNEGQPVQRHLRDYEARSGYQDNYCLFVSPRLHRDTCNTFFMAARYEFEGRPQKIVPLSIAQLRQLLEGIRALREAGGDFGRGELRDFYERALPVAGISSDQWPAHIQRVLNETFPPAQRALGA